MRLGAWKFGFKVWLLDTSILMLTFSLMPFPSPFHDFLHYIGLRTYASFHVYRKAETIQSPAELQIKSIVQARYFPAFGRFKGAYFPYKMFSPHSLPNLRAGSLHTSTKRGTSALYASRTPPLDTPHSSCTTVLFVYHSYHRCRDCLCALCSYS
ncbi:hypothetical protein F5890DRAFT_630233 [Lentinula detonsa]|uniref:Uncharacterized protein n=1 Tax=Lentinula detonsa TaxID=2804962 RepID=A0AA38PTE2_9AGAR|nr:hypothetical protein F5890DRAFT_630233 [Lentinula detonsa]